MIKGFNASVRVIVFFIVFIIQASFLFGFTMKIETMIKVAVITLLTGVAAMINLAIFELKK